MRRGEREPIFNGVKNLNNVVARNSHLQVEPSHISNCLSFFLFSL
jgi:hypothetical protein